MRIDIVSIFPDYLGPLELSLPGKARAKGLLELHVHDLRRWTHDRHRTVDDTPYGGGAGMVMRPEPWGEALDELLSVPADTTVIVTTPSGELLTQALARELATREHLVFACGRYEGIDQRVMQEAAIRSEVREVSIGDYVLNGGEVAALAIVESVIRLIPGFMGNPDSLLEESHQEGLLEYPVYTKPAAWRGHEVPPILLSGDHAAIETWRHHQAIRRTAQRRPDLAHRSRMVGEYQIVPATLADAGEIYTLQRSCWLAEAMVNDTFAIPTIHESLADVEASLVTWQTYAVRAAGRLIGSVRGTLDGEVWDIGRLMVAPDLQGRGLGRVLLEHIQNVARPEATSYRLITGGRSLDNIRLYKRAGFSVRGPLGDSVAIVMTKRR
jgi:tRNA (guanine37-N1)-methyltransferase